MPFAKIWCGGKKTGMAVRNLDGLSGVQRYRCRSGFHDSGGHIQICHQRAATIFTRYKDSEGAKHLKQAYRRLTSIASIIPIMRVEYFIVGCGEALSAWPTGKSVATDTAETVSNP
jgi:hypothetical protein